MCGASVWVLEFSIPNGMKCQNQWLTPPLWIGIIHTKSQYQEATSLRTSMDAHAHWCDTVVARVKRIGRSFLASLFLICWHIPSCTINDKSKNKCINDKTRSIDSSVCLPFFSRALIHFILSFVVNMKLKTRFFSLLSIHFIDFMMIEQTKKPIYTQTLTHSGKCNKNRIIARERERERWSIRTLQSHDDVVFMLSNWPEIAFKCKLICYWHLRAVRAVLHARIPVCVAPQKANSNEFALEFRNAIYIIV